MSQEAAGSRNHMGVGHANGNGNGELARQAQADWGAQQGMGGQQSRQTRRMLGDNDRQERQDGQRGTLGSPPGLGRRLAGGVISGPRERAALAQAERDAALAGYGNGYGRAAPSTVRIRGEFTDEQAHWIICYLWEHRPMWVGAKREAPSGRYYVELTHFQWPHVGVRVYIHDRNEFWELITSHRYDDLPVHHTAPPLPEGHRR